MRRHAIRVSLAGMFAALLLAACSSGGGHTAASTPSTSTAGSTSPPTTEVASTTPATAPSSASTTAAASASTTTAAGGCPQTGGATVPFSMPASKASALLTAVSATGLGCTDRVVFSFIVKSAGVPSCGVAYENGPFSQDASGAPVAVAGTAFAVLRCSPAYGYDFESGRTTYTGPKRITPAGTAHVRELVETGDFEGVVTWVVGLDTRVGFHVVVTTVPPGISTVAITFG